MIQRKFVAILILIIHVQSIDAQMSDKEVNETMVEVAKIYSENLPMQKIISYTNPESRVSLCQYFRTSENGFEMGLIYLRLCFAVSNKTLH